MAFGAKGVYFTEYFLKKVNYPLHCNKAQEAFDAIGENTHNFHRFLYHSVWILPLFFFFNEMISPVFGSVV